MKKLLFDVQVPHQRLRVYEQPPHKRTVKVCLNWNDIGGVYDFTKTRTFYLNFPYIQYFIGDYFINVTASDKSFLEGEDNLKKLPFCNQENYSCDFCLDRPHQYIYQENDIDDFWHKVFTASYISHTFENTSYKELYKHEVAGLLDFPVFYRVYEKWEKTGVMPEIKLNHPYNMHKLSYYQNLPIQTPARV